MNKKREQEKNPTDQYQNMLKALADLDKAAEHVRDNSPHLGWEYSFAVAVLQKTFALKSDLMLHTQAIKLPHNGPTEKELADRKAKEKEPGYKAHYHGPDDPRYSW